MFGDKGGGVLAQPCIKSSTLTASNGKLRLRCMVSSYKFLLSCGVTGLETLEFLSVLQSYLGIDGFLLEDSSAIIGKSNLYRSPLNRGEASDETKTDGEQD